MLNFGNLEIQNPAFVCGGGGQNGSRFFYTPNQIFFAQFRVRIKKLLPFY
jgi:hypothetical protein